MRIDCRDLICPEPVIKTKDAFGKLKIGQELEILVNDIACRAFDSGNGLELCCLRQ